MGTFASFHWLGHMRGSCLLLARRLHFLIAARSQTSGCPPTSQNKGYFTPISIQKLLKRAKMGLKATTWHDGQGEHQLFAVQPSARRTPGTFRGVRALQLEQDISEVFARELDADQKTQENLHNVLPNPTCARTEIIEGGQRIDMKRWQDPWKRTPLFSPPKRGSKFDSQSRVSPNPVQAEVTALFMHAATSQSCCCLKTWGKLWDGATRVDEHGRVPMSPGTPVRHVAKSQRKPSAGRCPALHTPEKHPHQGTETATPDCCTDIQRTCDFSA